MKTLEQLLAAWEDGTLNAEEIAELKAVLAQPEARARLVEDLQFYALLHDGLKTWQEQGSANLVAPMTKARSRPLLWRHVRFRWPWRAGAGLAACLVVLLYFVEPWRPAPLRVSEVQPGVMIERAGILRPAAAGARLYAKDIIKAPFSASATLQWRKEAASVRLRENTEVEVLLSADGKALRLSAGMVDATVAKRPRHRPMIFVTPHAEAKVIGTRFVLSVNQTASRLEVSAGAVEFLQLNSAASARPLTVGEGQFAVAGAGYEFAVQRQTGLLSRQTWSDGQGDLATNVPVSAAFVRWDYITNFQTFYWPHPFITNWGASYRARICGYLTPPRTGFYTFWMVSGASSELWLSPDNRPAGKERIAFTPAPADPASLQPTWNWALELPDSYTKRAGPRNAGHQGDWHKFASQKSAPEWLVAGRHYYIEARHEVAEGDWVGVLWAKPGDDAIIPDDIIRSAYLAPFME